MAPEEDPKAGPKKPWRARVSNTAFRCGQPGAARCPFLDDQRPYPCPGHALLLGGYESALTSEMRSGPGRRDNWRHNERAEVMGPGNYYNPETPEQRKKMRESREEFQRERLRKRHAEKIAFNQRQHNQLAPLSEAPPVTFPSTSHLPFASNSHPPSAATFHPPPAASSHLPSATTIHPPAANEGMAYALIYADPRIINIFAQEFTARVSPAGLGPRLPQNFTARIVPLAFNATSFDQQHQQMGQMTSHTEMSAFNGGQLAGNAASFDEQHQQMGQMTSYTEMNAYTDLNAFNGGQLAGNTTPFDEQHQQMGQMTSHTNMSALNRGHLTGNDGYQGVAENVDEEDGNEESYSFE